MLSSPKVGGNSPDLRLSDSGKLSSGTGRIGTPMNVSTAPLATPVSSSLSMRMLRARKIQAGIQPGKSSRWHVV